MVYKSMDEKRSITDDSSVKPLFDNYDELLNALESIFPSDYFVSDSNVAPQHS